MIRFGGYSLRTLLCTVVCLGRWHSLSAQSAEARINPSPDSLAGVDTNYVMPYRDHLIVAPHFAFAFLQQDFYSNRPDLANRNTSTSYQSNNRVLFGTDLTYGNFALAVALKLPGSSTNASRSNSLYTDLSASFIPEPLAVFATYKNYRGFTEIDRPSYDPNWPRDAEPPFRTDIQTRFWGIQGLYFFNHRKFSYNATFNFSGELKRSAGTWILGATAQNIRIKGDSTLIARLQQGNFQRFSGLSEAKVNSISLQGGAGGVWVISQRFFLAGILTLGPRIHVETHDVTGANRRMIGVDPEILVQGAFGYTSPKWIAAVTFNNMLAQSSSDELSTDFAYNVTRLYLVYRIHWPQLRQQAERKLPFLKKYL